MRSVILISCLVVLSSTNASGHTWLVPSEVPTIQAAIDGASDGDIIELANGTYTGDGNRDVRFLGKAVTVRSASDNPDSCIVDCEANADDPYRGFIFDQTEGPDSVLRGITVTNGYADFPGGGGILGITESWDPFAWYEPGPAPTIENCIVKLCGDKSVALYGEDTVPTITACKFIQNQGCGVYCWNSAPVITRCHFADNLADGFHGRGDLGPWVYPYLNDCMFEGNGRYGLALGMETGHAYLERCIVQNNASDGVRVWSGQKGGVSLNECQIVDNGGSGVVAPSEFLSVRATNCSIERNVENGIMIGSFLYFNEVQDCHILHNGGNGISFFPCEIPKDEQPEMREVLPTLIANNAIGYNGNGGIVGLTLLHEIVIDNCVVYRNTGDGIAVALESHMWPAPYRFTVRNTTVADNTGRGIVVQDYDIVVLDHALVANNGLVAASFPECDSLSILSTNLYENAGGDWVGVAEPYLQHSGNFYADPCFCPGIDDYHLAADSWCLPCNHPWGWHDLVGALGEGCDACGCNGPVPNLVSNFQAQAKPGRVILDWAFLLDADPSQFQIQASCGDLHWRVTPAVNSTGGFQAIDTADELARGGQVTYTLLHKNDAGKWERIWSEQVTLKSLPGVTRLTNIYPNPFNPETQINFNVASPQQLKVVVYDVSGRLVATLANRTYPVGSHSVSWQGQNTYGQTVACGTYVVRVETEDRIDSRRITLLK